MHRFHLPPHECRGPALTLAGPEAHHALRVLRVQTGERITLLDGAGSVLDCLVAAHTRDDLSLEVIRRQTAPPPPCAITLLQALPKGKIIEAVIQKATELGVARIVPLLSERVLTQLDPHTAQTKADKWQHIAIEATKQSGNPWLPKVETPLTPADFLARGEKFDLPLVACLEAGSRHPRAWFDLFRHEHGRTPATVAVWIGPEGDFTPEEYRAIQASGARPMTLGQLVLRVETAATCALSVVNYEVLSPAAS